MSSDGRVIPVPTPETQHYWDGAKAGEGLARAQAVEQYAGGNLGDGRAQIHGATDEADLSGGQAHHLLEMNGQNGAALTVDLHHHQKNKLFFNLEIKQTTDI